jgi:hypothetical protein
LQSPWNEGNYPIAVPVYGFLTETVRLCAETPRTSKQATKQHNLMKKTSTILALMALGVATATAGVAPAPSGKGPVQPPPADPCAGPISYNNVELVYMNTDNGFDSNDDGLRLSAEYSPMANFYVTATATYTDVEGGETWTLSGGIGGYLPLTNNINIALDGGIFHWDTDYDYVVTPVGGVPTRVNVSDDDTGWYVRPHIRAKWGCFEVHAGAMYVDVSDSNDWNWFAQVYYQVARNWDITAGYSEFDDSDGETWSVGARYKF